MTHLKATLCWVVLVVTAQVVVTFLLRPFLRKLTLLHKASQPTYGFEAASSVPVQAVSTTPMASTGVMSTLKDFARSSWDRYFGWSWTRFV